MPAAICNGILDPLGEGLWWTRGEGHEKILKPGNFGCVWGDSKMRRVEQCSGLYESLSASRRRCYLGLRYKLVSTNRMRWRGERRAG